MFLTFELRVCPKKQVLRIIVNDHFFSHPIFRPTYMMLQVWEAGDQRESDGVVTALQARCGRTLDHQWGAKWVCLKIGYIPNYSNLIGIMISKTIGFRGTNHFKTNPNLVVEALRRLHLKRDPSELATCLLASQQSPSCWLYIGDAVPARQTLRAYISNLAKYPQVTSSSFILLFGCV